MTVPGSTNFVLRQPSLPVPCRPTLVVAFKETDRLVWVQLGFCASASIVVSAIITKRSHIRSISQENVIMTETNRVEAPGYKVKRVEPVIKGSDVQVRVFTLAPGEAIPWHYHRQSTDHYFVLEGVVSISTREPEITVTRFPVGSSHEIAPETPHSVGNDGDRDCRFLLVQGVGAHDWIAAD